MEFDPEAVKELAKNSGGDYRSALLDTQSLAPTITIETVAELFPRMKKEKIFSVMAKIFKGHDMRGIQQMVNNSEVSSDFYDDVKLENGVVTYWSKKTKKYVPVKEKNKESIFFEIKTALGVEFATESELF